MGNSNRCPARLYRSFRVMPCIDWLGRAGKSMSGACHAGRTGMEEGQAGWARAGAGDGQGGTVALFPGAAHNPQQPAGRPRPIASPAPARLARRPCAAPPLAPQPHLQAHADCCAASGNLGEAPRATDIYLNAASGQLEAQPAGGTHPQVPHRAAHQARDSAHLQHRRRGTAARAVCWMRDALSASRSEVSQQAAAARGGLPASLPHPAGPRTPNCTPLPPRPPGAPPAAR